MLFDLIGRCLLYMSYSLILSSEVLGVQSPCPNYFRYFWNDRYQTTMGQVIIPSPPKYTDLYLEIHFTFSAHLPSKYYGRLELAKSKEESARDILQGRRLFYLVHFPITEPLPVLRKLLFNGQLYCSGPRVTGPIVSSIFLKYTFFPSRPLIISADSDNDNNNFDERPNFNNFIPSFNQNERSDFITKPPLQTSRPLQTLRQLLPLTTPTPPPSLSSRLIYNNYEDCGRENILNKNSNPLIATGVETKPNEWPWLVAIFIFQLKAEFQCTGTLVTNKHIITVAHCTRLNDSFVPANTMLASLGRYHLWDQREKGSIYREIKEYKIHPDYKNKQYDHTADADIAVMILRETVEFSISIKPICLWTGSNDLRDIVGSEGHVIGWGKNEFGQFLNEPRKAVVPIVSQEDCLWSNPVFVNITSNRTLCAGFRNGSGPCNGDSGSGLLIRRKDGRYYLRGAVSHSILDGATKSCDLNNYIVYVDLTKYIDWIRLQISS